MISPIDLNKYEVSDGAYAADTGADLLCAKGTPVRCAMAGKVIYSEPGHTPWVASPDTPNSALIKLDVPFLHKGITYYYNWYTHMSELARTIYDGDEGPYLSEGDPIGKTGLGNHVPHLHFGIIVDRPQIEFMSPFAVADLIFNSKDAPKHPNKFFIHDGRYAVILGGITVAAGSTTNKISQQIYF